MSIAFDPNASATITEIERFAVHDGPGIRTLVFLKGCGLNCLWCCNPETRSFTPQLSYSRSRCIECGRCVEACPENALTSGGGGLLIDRKLCSVCGKCAEVCAPQALELAGQIKTACEVMSEIERDQVFYQNSGGGVTLSGGEALLSPEFSRALLAMCKQAGLHTAVETCGFVSWESFAEVMPYLDLVLFDLKHLDSNRHEEGTGVHNQKILANLSRLDQNPIEIQLRFPLIPGFNDSEENLRQTARLAASLRHATRIDLLPYHRLGKPKYEKFGMDYRLADLHPPEPDQIERFRKILLESGLPVTVGG